VFKTWLERTLSPRPHDIALLLSGPSLKQLENSIDSLRGKTVHFYAINRKQHIEKNILSRIGRKIDVWTLMSPMEMEALLDEVYAFLEDPDTTMLITSSIALKAVEQKLLQRPLPNTHKLIMADEWLFCVFDYFYRSTQNKPLASLFEIKGELNTLFILLVGILQRAPLTRIYLFGCDGLPEPDRVHAEASYYGAQCYDSTRLSFSNLYGDMVNFERYWPVFAKQHGMHKAKITNANPSSHYQCLKKKPLLNVLQEIN